MSVIKKKKFTKFRPHIRSRHPSHNILRGKLPFFPFRSVVRFGSPTEYTDNRVEINTTEAIKNSSNKRRMKKCFTKGDVRTALWYTFKNGTLYDEINKINTVIEQLPFPIVAKKHFGSKNKGNTKIDTLEEFKEFIKGISLNEYIFEKYYNFSREYRLHVTESGCFYTCRKMMKKDTPEEKKWFKNDQNCVWILEGNPNFEKPNNWKEVVKESVKALKSVGLDFGAVDLRIQGPEVNDPSFIVIEINSAPSFGDITAEKYAEMLPTLIQKKFNK